MKNIHLIKTDKPSRLHLDKTKYLSYDLGFYSKDNKSFGSYQNIYITSNEEIKEGDWCHDIFLQAIFQANSFMGIKTKNTAKKIILTTDQDLIKDGVQSIDDEFLQWFVNNPNCEEVEVKIDCDICALECTTNKCPNLFYKIIIPKEEPKDVVLGYKTSLDAQMLDKIEPKQEIWKDIPDYEGLYQVSNFGNVKSLERYVKGKVENRLQKENILSKRLVGDIENQYYAVTLCNNKNRKQIKVSVLVAMAFLNHIPNGYVGFTVDHIDNNPLNNNVNNLQVITKRENSSKDKKGISKYTGVTFNKKTNKWRSQIWINGKNKTLGSFDDELEAHRVYQKELQQYLKSQ